MACAGLLATGGCATASHYATPRLAAPAAWSIRPAASPAMAVQGPWWQAFDDPRLDALVARVLDRNPGLIAATIKVRRARLQAQLEGNALVPQLSGSASGTTTTTSGGTASGGSSGTRYASNIAAAYEVDLFHRLGSLRDAARFEAEATEDDRDAARLSLVGTVVTTYFQRLQLRDQLTLTDASLAYARRTLDLVEAQYRAGAASGLERAEARRLLHVQEADRTQIVRNAVEAENMLVALLDGERPAASIGSLERVALPPVDAGLPAALLGRRPDLRAAEHRLRSSLANVDATTASFYPNITLNGAANGAGAGIGSILSNPLGSLLGNIALPFLNVEKARLSRGISRTTYEEGIANFHQTFAQAVRDVENALIARQQLNMQAAGLEAAVGEARTAERLAELRYRVGAIALRDWLAAQELRRQAESALLASRLQLLTNHVQLLQALGGDQAVPTRTSATAAPRDPIGGPMPS